MNYTLGESLLDVIFNNLNEVVAKPGGSMLNAAVSMARMDLEVSHISELGDNQVALMLVNFLKKEGINTSNIKQYHKTNTSVALAFLDQDKKPSYQFVNAYPAVRSLPAIPEFKTGDLLLFGSIYSVSQPIREDFLKYLHAALNAGTLLMYDPNMRHKHHLENQHMKEAVMENMRLAHIIKASDEDCLNLFGKGNPEYYFDKIQSINPNALILITLGEHGAVARSKKVLMRTDAIKIQLVSTVGAGDAFNAGIVKVLSELNITQSNIIHINEAQIMTMLNSGTKRAAEVCTSYDNYIARPNAV